jgi:hypothetical protein
MQSNPNLSQQCLRSEPPLRRRASGFELPKLRVHVASHSSLYWLSRIPGLRVPCKRTGGRDLHPGHHPWILRDETMKTVRRDEKRTTRSCGYMRTSVMQIRRSNQGSRVTSDTNNIAGGGAPHSPQSGVTDLHVTLADVPEMEALDVVEPGHAL